MSGGAKWADLRVRILSAAVLLTVAAVDIWAGGVWFRALVGLVTAGMIWELLRMLGGPARGAAVALGVVAGGAVLLLQVLPPAYLVPVVGALVIAGAGPAGRNWPAWVLYAPVILLAGNALIWMRDDIGVAFLLWVICVVVASDVCGYFAGRLIGGPKFWPRFSPKKTWSGTVAGWLGAVVVGYAFSGPLDAVSKTGFPLWGLMLASGLLALAGQLGDIAESAIKRHVGVKDSSALIPGHGGLLDRFDALIAAAVVAWLGGGLL